ncbi:N-acetylmuramoyl-L-alanine amidase [Candidatus Odyssella acanthamoebae]|uniref:N-acetylmuramoyl-L-alanine amidase n=1 Tax=Candidatus Odyssella acanthamoebae TaxID=91604 RepID=UPI000690EE0B|nr:N-acetylmuramoyl-L-alanine amidase [Candidatus Paracaedibacter acanthamoebae]
MKKIIYTYLTTAFTLATSMAYDIINIPSENFNSRGETPIQLIVAHCVGLDLDKTLKGFAYKDTERGGLGAAPHYLIPQITAQTFIDHFSDLFNLNISLKYPHKVPVIQFVNENDRAWQAGVSCWSEFNKLPGCEKGLNSCSIGIEFHAPGYGAQAEDWFHFIPFTDAQMETGANLMLDICERHKIDKRNVWGHSDIAPWSSTQIKTDPGPLFPWQWFYINYKLGVWPISNPTSPEIGEQQSYVKERLTALGYKMSDGNEWTELDRHVVNAFRMHFMQDSYKVIYPTDENFGKIDAMLIKYLGQNFDS